MKFGINSRYKQKTFLLLTIVLTSALATLITLKSVGKIWADETEMTEVTFSSALFCQSVSQAIIDSLGSGAADGSNCTNFKLNVSTAQISNIQTLNITPPPGDFSGIDWTRNSIAIGGSWMYDFYNLTSLSITNMHVQDISPLQTLSHRLIYLDLSGNPIKTELRTLSFFTRLETLKLSNTGLTNPNDLFKPITSSEYGGTVPDDMKDASNLAKVLRILDISDNTKIATEKTTYPATWTCSGNLSTFKNYGAKMELLTEIYASNDNLNTNDLICILDLENLEKIDISNNHIDDFSSVRGKGYTVFKADSQTFTREIESLDYEDALPKVFTQAQTGNYLGNPSAQNNAVELAGLTLDNATLDETTSKFRIIDAVIASRNSYSPHPATITIPSNTGVFENTKLIIYFDGQLVTFNNSDVCNKVYQQGESGTAFVNASGTSNWNLKPVVLTNACNATEKQIAMVKNGSSKFYRLNLNDTDKEGNNEVDLTGLEVFTNLQVLYLENNGLITITALNNLKQLQQLFLNNNNLGRNNDNAWNTITTNLKKLGILYFNKNGITSIPTAIKNLSQLGNLYLADNNITNISPLAYVPSLTVLDLSDNPNLRDFSGLAQNTSVCAPILLKLENTGISSIPRTDILERIFSNLTNLNLNNNSITSESINNLAVASRLGELYLNDNQIENTSGFSGLSNLKKLFLDNNRISDISGLTTGSLTQLAELHLSNNRIESIEGLNTLPALATLDLRGQMLSGKMTDSEESYSLPAVFSQATSLEFPNVNDFQSTGEYTVTNGTIDYSNMTATPIDASKTMTITIPNGGLAETKATILPADTEFRGRITDKTNGGAEITVTSKDSFTVTSDKACMVLWSQDNGATWNRVNGLATGLLPPPQSDINPNASTRTFPFGTELTESVEVVVAYAGNVNTDNFVNVRDAKKIINYTMAKDTLSNLEIKLADVNGDNRVNVRDARLIINNAMGKSHITW